jgi:hypothetical protein
MKRGILMKKSILTAVIFSLSFAANAEMDQYKAEAKKITGEFFNELKGELVKGMKSGGPINAIGICNTLAPAIAAKHSEQTGWDVGRTSLKLRNPGNAPDEWETAVLKKFEERRANGEAPDTLAFAEVVEENGEKHFRFMKGIVMPPVDKMPCLKCHGENLDPEITTALDKLYPTDNARGYKAGQVRGAFTLKKKL